MRVTAAGPPIPGRSGSAGYSPTVAVLPGAPETPGSALSFLRSSDEAAPPRFRDRLDARMHAEGAQQIADVVADRLAA
jgi:hypothetical protein